MLRLSWSAAAIALAAALLGAVAVAPGCGGHADPESYATFQECWTDHSVNESLTPAQSIAVCCLEHPIGGTAENVVCGNDQTACETYVTANLMPADATTAQITAGCADYLTQRGM